MGLIKKIGYIFTKKQKIRLLLLLFVIAIGTFLELMGVTAIMPFINVVMDPQSIQKKWYLKVVYEGFGFQNEVIFMVFLAIILAVVYVVKNVYLCIMYNLQYHFTFSNQRKFRKTLCFESK